MSAREELYAAVMSGGYHSPERSERASARIDAFRAEVLREAAEKIRAMNEGCGRTQCVSCDHRSDAADLIDPEVRK